MMVVSSAWSWLSVGCTALAVSSLGIGAGSGIAPAFGEPAVREESPPRVVEGSATFGVEPLGGTVPNGERSDGSGTELACPAGSLFSQSPQPPPFFDSHTSDLGGGFFVFENYVSGEAICGVRFWGFSIVSGGMPIQCLEEPMTFEVSLLDDANGLPGVEACAYTVDPITTRTGVHYRIFGQILELNEYAVELNPCCALESGWVSVRGVSVVPDDCWFSWISSPVGDSQAWQQDPQGVWSGIGDRALCLTGGTGACCLENETCQVLGPNDCTSAGGAYKGDFTTCGPNTCFLPSDTCEDAVPVPGLPFHNTGDTCDYADDYDEACPSAAPGSPDVVYRYDPLDDVSVVVTLCDGLTDYDTTLYAYENNCSEPGSFVACNEDACTSAAGVEGVSRFCLNLSGGTAYYFVVDGHGGDCGRYAIDIAEDTEPPVIQACAAPITLYVGVGEQAHVPDFTGDLTASDNCGNVMAVTQVPAEGTRIGLGTHVVTITATDDAGLSDSCQATLTVEGTGSPRLLLFADQVCYAEGGPVVVEVWMANIAESVTGGQFFLQYDESKLELVTAPPGAGVTTGSYPFIVQTYECSVDESAEQTCLPIQGLIDYRVDAPVGDPGAPGTAKMAVIAFTATEQITNAVELVTFRPHVPSTSLLDPVEGWIVPLLSDLDVVDDDSDGDGVADCIDLCPDTSPGTPVLADGCADCNSNGIFDLLDITSGTSPDCNSTGVPDECDLAAGSSLDCNTNGIPDECDMNCGSDGPPELRLAIIAPEHACVLPGEPVTVTLVMACLQDPVRGYQAFMSFDADSLTFDSGEYHLPNPFGLPLIDQINPVGGAIDMASGIDDFGGQAPAICSADLATLRFIAGDTLGPTQIVFPAHQPPTDLADRFGNSVQPALVDSPSIMIVAEPHDCMDCNDNGIIDLLDITSGTSPDCNTTGVPDECDLAAGHSFDCDGNNRPDECETDCDPSGRPELTLAINEPDNFCVLPGEAVTVTLSMSCLRTRVRGFQAFASFDPDRLTFDFGEYSLPSPFGLPLIDWITAVDGEIAMASGIDDFSGQVPASCPADLVTLRFFAGTAPGPTQVMLPAHEPPTQLADEFGGQVQPLLVHSPTIIVAEGAQDCADCNSNGIVDVLDIGGGTSQDCNTTGVPDECELAAGSNVDCNGNGTPDECDPIQNGDFDADGDVDLDDLTMFVACMAGPNTPPNPVSPGCSESCLRAFDLEQADGDIDLMDFGGFQRVLAGP